MGRQNKVNFLFKGLVKATEYTVAEIVALAGERGTLDVIYPDCPEKDQVRKARQLVQSHINSRGLQSAGMRKDLKIALDEAQRNGASLEMTALVDKFYEEVQALGGSRWDTSSLIARLL